MQTSYASKIKLLVGMEIDWIRPSSKECIHALLDRYRLDLFIGSVHHVHTIPIDFDRNMYLKARVKSGGTDERLFEDYFDLQLEMLQVLKPPIIGHFDLIRLVSDDQNASLKRWHGVWHRILRNLDFIAKYRGVIELNAAALRKGMNEPYPQADICKVSYEEFINLKPFTVQQIAHSTHRRSLLEVASSLYLMIVMESSTSAPTIQDC